MLGDTAIAIIISALVIGAVSFYLYSRITYLETKEDSLENLLLSLHAQTELRRYPGGGGDSAAAAARAAAEMEAAEEEYRSVIRQASGDASTLDTTIQDAAASTSAAASEASEELKGAVQEVTGSAVGGLGLGSLTPLEDHSESLS